MKTPSKLTAGHLIILALGLFLTTLISFYFYQSSQKEFTLSYESATEEILHNIRTRFERYELALIQARAFLMHAEPITNADFQSYLRNTELLEKYPGMQGLAYLKTFNQKDAEDYIQERKKSDPEFTIWPKLEDQVSPVIYLAPLDWRNKRALGFNMMSEPIRRKALDEARDSGRTSLSGVLTLMQENGIDTQPGIILFVPLYGKTVPETLEARRQYHSGFVTMPFRFQDLISAIFAKSPKKNIDFEIYHDQKNTEHPLLYDHDKEFRGENPLEKTLKIGNYQYKVHFFAKPQFAHRPSLLAFFYVFASGVIVTFLLIWIFHITSAQVELKQRALEAKDEFVSIASHELRTPMASLQLQLQILQRSMKDNQLPSTEKMKKFFGNSLYQMRKMNRLIEELLQMTQLERGRLHYQFESTDLTQVVRQNFEEHGLLLTDSNSDIEFKLEDNVIVDCDKFRIEQVLSNLINNAVKYGNQSLITVALHRDDTKAYLSVKDRGPGIAPEQQQRIFERFERAGNTRTISGLGLGLYISHQIVLAHHGTIRVQSQLGSGAEFVVEIPLKHT